MRFLITFSYDGSKYSGYQKQIGKKTIDQEIEQALTKINSNKKIKIYGSGRTDAGVHANNQKAHFDLDKKIDCHRLQNSINKLISNNIYIKNIQEVDNLFHARFNAIKKEYLYKINIEEYNPIQKDYVYQYNKSLDIDNMIEATKHLIGEHDFTSFTKDSNEKETCVRIIYSISIEQIDNIINITFVGNGFLRYMIRNLVGTLIEVGSNKRKPIEIKEIIDSKDRKKAGITAPACGLYLNNVYYNK